MPPFLRQSRPRRIPFGQFSLEQLERREMMTVSVGESEPNGSTGSADRFQVDPADGGVQLTGSIQTADDRDFFVWSAPQAGQVRLSTQASGGLVAKASVETTAGVKLLETEPNDGVNSGSFNIAQGQTVVIRLEGKNDSTGSYLVAITLNGTGTGTNPGTPGGGTVVPPTAASSVTESEPNDNRGTADPVGWDANNAASIRGVSQSDRDRDFFAVRPAQSGTLQVNVARTSGVQAKLEVTDNLGNQLGETQPNDGVNTLQLRVIGGETLYLRLRSPNSSPAGYAVDLAFAAGGSGTTPTGPIQLLGQNQQGEWWAARFDDSQFANTLVGQWSSNTAWSDMRRGDFDGDGTDDVVGRSGNGSWWLGRSTATGLQTTRWGQWSTNVNWNDILVADVNGDGKDDLVGRTGNGVWWVARSTGNQFVNEFWGKWSSAIRWQDVQIADVDGNGRDDVIGRTAQGVWYAAQSLGTQFSSQRWGAWSSRIAWRDVRAADVDGDGKDDVIGRSDDGQWWVARSQGGQFTNEAWGRWSPSVAWHHVEIADMNGDGKDDLVGLAAGGTWWVAQSTGSRFSSHAIANVPGLQGISTVRVTEVGDDSSDEVAVLLQNGQWWVIDDHGGGARRVGSWGSDDRWSSILA